MAWEIMVTAKSIRDPLDGRIPATPWVEAIRPYPVVSQEALSLVDPARAMKLDWNESTVSPPALVIHEVRRFLEGRPLNWYPDVAATTLTTALSGYTGLPTESILTFAGSDSALEYVTRAYLEPGARVTTVSPTYDNFRVYAEAAGAHVEAFTYTSPLDPDLAELDAIVPGSRLIYLGSPNNPTGTEYDDTVIRRLASRHRSSLVVVDEAYHEYSERSVIDLVRAHPNLLVTRTFSKAFGLAGFRIGYVVAHPTIVDVLARIRVGKSVNALGQVAAVAALDAYQDVREYCADVRWGMSELEKGLTEIGIQCHPTPANFMIIRPDDPASLSEALRGKNVFVRNLAHLAGLSGCLRITVGTAIQMHELLTIVRPLVEAPAAGLAR